MKIPRQLSLSLAHASAEERTELAGAFASALLDDPGAESSRHPPLPRPGELPEEVRAGVAGPTSVRPLRPRDRSRGGVRHLVLPTRPDQSARSARAGRPREGDALGGFHDRAVASLVASVLPAAATENPFEVGDREHGRGHAVFHDGLLLGHVADPDAELPARLHLAYTYAANLEALAHLLEGLDIRALVFLGRVLARRLKAAERDGRSRESLR
jgi:hypothetical protein